jgi:hypothetical protein
MFLIRINLIKDDEAIIISKYLFKLEKLCHLSLILKYYFRKKMIAKLEKKISKFFFLLREN